MIDAAKAHAGSEMPVRGMHQGLFEPLTEVHEGEENEQLPRPPVEYPDPSSQVLGHALGDDRMEPRTGERRRTPRTTRWRSD